MTEKTKIWLKALSGAAISGAAGGVLTAVGSTAIAPATFNMQAGLYNLFLMTAWGIGSGAIIGCCNHLKQSPLPK